MKTRQILIDSLKELLETNRFEAITIQNIIDKAGVSRPTFYKYFENKYDLAAKIFSDSITKEFLMQYHEDNYFEFQSVVFRFIYENQKYIRKLFGTTGQESFPNFLTKYITESYLQHGKERFGITEFTAEQLFKTDAAANQWVFCIGKWVEEGCQIPIEQFICWVKDIIPIAERIYH